MLTLNPDYFPLRNGDVILDLGCGEGRHVSGLLEKNRETTLIGVDLNLKDLKQAKEKIDTWFAPQKKQSRFIQANALTLPFKDHSFDHIICSEVLEHLPDYQSVLEEIHRLLKPGGQLCVSVPRRWPEKICWALSSAYHQVEGGHVRIFRARELKSEVTTLGFSSYKKHWAHALHSPYWWLKCMFWEKDNFLLRLYHKLLVWDLMEKPWLTRKLELLLNPLMGKSVVFYFRKTD